MKRRGGERGSGEAVEKRKAGVEEKLEVEEEEEDGDDDDDGEE